MAHQGEVIFGLEPLEGRMLLSALSVRANVDTTPLMGNQVGAKIAEDPANPNILVEVGEDAADNSNSIVVSRSSNAGRTWTSYLYGGAQDHLNGSTQRPDARVAFDAFGNCYLVYIIAPNADEIRLVLATSHNFGASFKASSIVYGPGTQVDDPEIGTGVDARRQYRQQVWISYTDERDGFVRVVRLTSWSLGVVGQLTAPEVVSGETGNASQVAVAPDGAVTISWESPENKEPANIFESTDLDGAGSTLDFGNDVLVSRVNVGYNHVIPAQSQRSIDTEPVMAYDTSGGQFNGRLYLAYTDAVDSGDKYDTDILLKYSNNDGATWSSATFVNDDDTANSQFLPSIAVDNLTGAVGVTWLDARNSSNNTTAQEYGTVSLDGGNTFLANTLMSEGTSSALRAVIPSGFDHLDFGDNTGLTFMNRTMFPAWADDSDSTGVNPDGTSGFDLFVGIVKLYL